MYYIEYKKNGKKVKEEFKTIPKGVHYAAGYNDPKDKGKAFLTRLEDGGTSLIPLIVTKTNKQYKKQK